MQLYNVLAAYSIYNTEIGYCQGMASIAALLLMHFKDEEVSIKLKDIRNKNEMLLLGFFKYRLFFVNKCTFWGLSELISNPKYAIEG